MNIAIIDDALMNIHLLDSMLRDVLTDPVEIHHAQTVEEGIALLETQRPDLVFLDIELGAGYGFDIVDASAYKDFELIIVSAYPQFALKSYHYNPIHYLLKPLKEENLREGLDRYDERKGTASQTSKPQPNSIKKSLKKRISLPENGRLRFVEIADIVYLESRNVYTIFHLKEGMPMTVSKGLAKYERLLPTSHFHRIHDRYIVNLHYINCYEQGRGGMVELTSGEELSVSTRRKQGFLEKLDKQNLC